MLETHTPRQGGTSLISELTSSYQEVSRKVDTSDDKERCSLGALIGNASHAIQEDDSREYFIRTVRDIADSDLNCTCCKRWADGKNTFCVAINCAKDHRNSGPKVSLDLDTMVIVRAKDAAFASPLGSSRSITSEVLNAWKSQTVPLAEWSHRFFLARSSDDASASFKDLESIEDFSMKASVRKTPSKPPQVKATLSPFTPHDKAKFLKSMVNLKSDGFGKTTLEYFDRVDQHFSNVKGAIDNVVNNMNQTNDEIFATLRMLEFKKNKIKSDLGDCNNVSISETFDAASIWEVVKHLSDHLDNVDSTSGKITSGPLFSKGDIAAFRSFETYACGALDQHSLLLRKVALRHEVDKSIESLKDENVELHKEN